ncbi:hypothetical protein K2173_016799 [Erythroxylum novogranatense]|uniref:ETFB lysine methyltransferase n=1 Tax=Erythroxylum novogranatense TaxID=1862640 RepID=A0AAV8SS39_9ROSI|nr:hypothetical protein K2173_016799 [Erythroxylum novogranatense]
MSKSRLFKHLSHAFSCALIHQPKFKSNSHFYLKLISPQFLSQIPVSLSASSSSLSSSSSLCPHSSLSNSPVQSSCYFSVRICCPKDAAELLSEVLLSFGASSTSMDEDDGCESSNESYINSIFLEYEDVGMCISQAANSIGLEEIPTYEVNSGKQCDWVQKTQEVFDPIEVTKGLWIIPEWRSTPDTQATNIFINPGLAFGAGEHPTTQLCLMFLKSVIKEGDSFLDYGTGSGILAIAALKLGAALAVGLDIDPQAITSARHNAALNGIGPEKLKVLLVPGKTTSTVIDEGTDEVQKERTCRSAVTSETGKHDVVIANILLNPLLEFADHIVSYAKPEAVVGISGIISEQVPFIIDRYSVLLGDISVSEMDDWACVSGRKKS